VALRFNILAAACLFATLTTVSASADEAAGPRTQLDKILAVLRVRTQAASKACLTAMTQVHETEQQVKNHENDSGNHSDLDIARDVLDSDYQNSSQLCGVDADRACRESPGADVSRLCLALHRDGT
jgi:hypothetical protein